MKVTFVVPGVGKKAGQRYIGTWKMEPLTVATLSALTPPDIERTLVDDRIELIDLDQPTDIVAITVESYTARRAYALADRFAERGVRVILGGYHVTLMPDEAAEHAGTIVTGNAESVWSTVMADAAAGRLRPRYDGQARLADVVPDRSIYAGKRYLPVGLVETGRGCGHSCEFCSIAGYYGPRYHPRPVDRIVADVADSGRRILFLVDDNFIADRDHVLRLCRALEPLHVLWFAQGTLEMARDPELLRAMKAAGCELILIGFESLDDGTLRAMGKRWSTAVGERAELVRRIHDAGIGIYATFVLGYDGDTRETVARTLEFARESAFHTAAFNHLLPFPGTRLYHRLEREGRLLSPRWWLDENYRYGHLAYRPTHLAPEEASELCRQARREFGSGRAVIGRGMSALRRGRLAAWPIYWVMNLRLGQEIEEKYDIPIGRHLDELPK